MLIYRQIILRDSLTIHTSFDGMVDYPLSMIITEQGECLAYSINADIQSEMQLLQLMMNTFNLDNHLRKSDRT